MSTNLKRILILTLRPLHNGPRIIREIEAFMSHYEVVAVGLSKPKADVRFYNIKSARNNIIDRIIRKLHMITSKGKLPTYRLPMLDKFVRDVIFKERPVIVITHEPDFLPYLTHLTAEMPFKIVYNAHEYHPLQFDSNENWLKTVGVYYDHLYRKYLNDVDLLVNVCDGIAIKCHEEFDKLSLVIPNVSWYHNISPYFTNQDDAQIKIIHHGLAIRERKIEYMIEAVKRLSDSYRLDLILVPGDLGYIKELTEKADDCKRINIIQPISFDKIIPFLNKYDIGLFNLPPLTFNYRNALPNKLFEFIQARLCLVISPSPEMKKIVEQYDVGFVTDGYGASDIYNCLNSIGLDEINRCKLNSDKAAELVSAERYYKTYLNSIKKLDNSFRYL